MLADVLVYICAALVTQSHSMNLKELNVSAQNTSVGNGMYHLARPLLVEPSAASTDKSIFLFFFFSFVFLFI